MLLAKLTEQQIAAQGVIDANPTNCTKITEKVANVAATAKLARNCHTLNWY